jgi:hypothetical protein
VIHPRIVRVPVDHGGPEAGAAIEDVCHFSLLQLGVAVYIYRPLSNKLERNMNRKRTVGNIHEAYYDNDDMDMDMDDSPRENYWPVNKTHKATESLLSMDGVVRELVKCADAGESMELTFGVEGYSYDLETALQAICDKISEGFMTDRWSVEGEMERVEFEWGVKKRVFFLRKGGARYQMKISIPSTIPVDGVTVELKPYAGSGDPVPSYICGKCGGVLHSLNRY